MISIGLIGHGSVGQMMYGHVFIFCSIRRPSRHPALFFWLLHGGSYRPIPMNDQRSESAWLRKKAAKGVVSTFRFLDDAGHILDAARRRLIAP
jgi:hypothetical protein